MAGHNWALDVALARGIALPIEGKEWTFTPLTMNDWADVIAGARAIALKAYNEAMKDVQQPPGQRIKDVNGILFGRDQSQATLGMLHEPATRREMVKRSLLHKHPDVTDEEIDKILEGEMEAQLGLEILEMISVGPLPPDKEGDGPENPTEPQSGTGNTSADSSVVSVSPSKTLEK